jgi:hypothetical protein
MTLITTQKTKSECEKNIEVWFNKMELPVDIYQILSSYLKDVLSRRICKSPKVPSTEELRRLYGAFCSTMEFRSDYYRPSDEATDEYIRDFFAPLSDNDMKPKDDWGG